MQHSTAAQREVRTVPMLAGGAAEIPLAPEQYQTFERLTGTAAVRAGVPVLINPHIACGEYIAAFGETAETIDWQGTWISPATTFLVHRMERKGDGLYPGLGFDAAKMARQTLKHRTEVSRPILRAKARLPIWGGFVEWAHVSGAFQPEGMPAGYAHAVAFDWISDCRRVETIGVYQINVLGRTPLQPELMIENLLIDSLAGES